MSYIHSNELREQGLFPNFPTAAPTLIQIPDSTTQVPPLINNGRYQDRNNEGVPASHDTHFLKGTEQAGQREKKWNEERETDRIYFFYKWENPPEKA